MLCTMLIWLGLTGSNFWNLFLDHFIYILLVVLGLNFCFMQHELEGQVCGRVCVTICERLFAYVVTQIVFILFRLFHLVFVC